MLVFEKLPSGLTGVLTVLNACMLLHAQNPVQLQLYRLNAFYFNGEGMVVNVISCFLQASKLCACKLCACKLCDSCLKENSI